jgi:hypothetical protein
MHPMPHSYPGSALAIKYTRWQRRRKESWAQGWPSAEARILHGKVVPVPKTNRYLATLTYSYYVEEYRSGTYTHEFTREAEADEFIRQMKDKKVQIRYDPGRPGNSVLEQSAVEQMVLLAPRFG